jgi:hypothetical protein
MRIRTKIMIVLFIMALAMFSCGFYFYLLGKPLKVMKSATNNLLMMTKKVTDNKLPITLKDNMSITGNVKIGVTSNYYNSLATTDTTIASYVKLFNNISNTDTDFVFKQDKDNKKLYFSIASKLNNSNLINTKYLVENNTEYYYIDGVSSNYINNGNSSYFEALNSNTSTLSNISYVLEKAANSFNDNIKESDLKRITTTTDINSSTEKVNKTSLVLDKKMALSLMSAIVSDLQKDSRAKTILTGLDNNFSKYKVNSSDLDNYKTITINIYTDTLTAKIKKYEIISEDSKITLEAGNNSYSLRYYDKNTLENSVSITKNADTWIVSVSDSEAKNVATLKFTNKDYDINMDGSFNSDGYVAKITYSSKKEIVKKDNEYSDIEQLSLDVTKNSLSFVNINLVIKLDVSNTANIDEDASNAILQSSLTKSKDEAYSEQLLSILGMLMS